MPSFPVMWDDTQMFLCPLFPASTPLSPRTPLTSSPTSSRTSKAFWPAGVVGRCPTLWQCRNCLTLSPATLRHSPLASISPRDFIGHYRHPAVPTILMPSTPLAQDSSNNCNPRVSQQDYVSQWIQSRAQELMVTPMVAGKDGCVPG